MDTEKLIELLIQERLSFYFKTNEKNKNEEVKKFECWKQRLLKINPELAEEYQEYMDWLAEHSGNEQEGIYVFGMCDGIRIMKKIMGV